VQSSRRFTAPFITVMKLGPEYGQTKWDPALGRTVTFTPAATGSGNL